MNVKPIWRVLVLLLFSGSRLVAQDRSAYGAFADANVNMHSADFRAFPGVPSCCPKYDNGSGSGISIGALYQLSISSSMRLGLRAAYVSAGGTLSHTETTTLAGNIPGSFEHTVQASIASFGVEPLLQYKLVSSLWFSIGARAASVTQSTFSQKEVIVSPNSGVFSNGLAIRNEVNDAKIPDAQTINAGALAGISYDLALNKAGNFVLAPEVLYYIPVVGVVKQMDWKVSQLRAGLALKWSPLPGKERVKRTEQKWLIDTLQIQGDAKFAGIFTGEERVTSDVKETDDELLTTQIIRRTDTLRLTMKAPVQALAATVTASALEADGREAPELKVVVEEFSSVLMTPLLNYVFFDENSDTIPSRYKHLDSKGVERFREERINNSDRLVTYYQLLNIVGKRMRINNGATLTLVGCNADVGAEKGNTELSKRRAEAVKKYLVDTWSIPEGRVKIEARNQPTRAANVLSKDGAQENRRVEILSDNSAIVAPLITADTLRTITPPSVRFRSQVVYDNEISDWKLTAVQDGNTLKRFDGTGNVPKILDWNVDEEKGTQPRSNSKIVYDLSVHDTKDAAVHSENSIAVDQVTLRRKKVERIADKEINRFSLILFDVRSTEVSSQNLTVAEMIKGYIKPQSVVHVTGYTDRLGDAAQNQTLAIERARNTAKVLGVKDDKGFITGKGNSTTYDAELPEGRLYTRTVDIVIESSTQ